MLNPQLCVVGEKKTRREEFTDNSCYYSFEYAKWSTRETSLLTFNFKLIIHNNPNLTKEILKVTRTVHFAVSMK